MCNECAPGLIHVEFCGKTAETVLRVLSGRDPHCLTDNQRLAIGRVLLTDYLIRTQDDSLCRCRQGAATLAQIDQIASYFPQE